MKRSTQPVLHVVPWQKWGRLSVHVARALWGASSYNIGVGMSRLLTNAAFVHSNMPLGTVWNHPAITNEDTYDVAADLSSKERPQISKLEKDYPKLEKRAVNCPYLSYADDFSQEQHQYGPFQPIKAAQKKKEAARQLDQSFRRLQVDMIDPVQHYEVLRHEDPHTRIAPRIFDA